MIPAFYSEPWSCFCGAEGLAIKSADGSSMATGSSVRVVGDLGHDQFRWNGIEPDRAAFGIHSTTQHWYLPVLDGSGVNSQNNFGWGSSTHGSLKVSGLPSAQKSALVHGFDDFLLFCTHFGLENVQNNQKRAKDRARSARNVQT